MRKSSVRAAAPENPLAKVIEALTTIADALNLALVIEDKTPKTAASSPADRKQQHQDDLGWLTSQPGLCSHLRGNWVAVSEHRIVAIGPDERVVRIGAAAKLGIPRKDVLVVPIQVPGSDELWAATCERLGIEVDMSALAP